MKQQYDLVSTSRGLHAFRSGTFEELNEISLAPFNPDAYVVIECSREIYRVEKRIAETAECKKFIKRANSLPPITDEQEA